MSDNTFPIILGNVVTHSPMYIVWVIGIILAIATWKRNPRPSLFAVLAITLLFIFDLISIFVLTIPMRLTERGKAVTHIGTMILIANLTLTILKAGSWGFLLAAIFGGRKQ